MIKGGAAKKTIKTIKSSESSGSESSRKRHAGQNTKKI